MTPLNRLTGIHHTNSTGNAPPVTFRVIVATTTPTRREVADAYFAHFGFKRADAPFIRQHADGVDLFAQFERGFHLKAGSLKTGADGQTHVTLEADAHTYKVMKRLGELKRGQQPNAMITNPTEARQAKQVFDSSAMLKARLNQQLDAQQAGKRQAMPVSTPPATTSSSAVTTSSATPAAKNAEGIGAFFDGAVRGDFSDNDSWSKLGGQVVAGAIPVYGQIADARDTVAAVRAVWSGKQGAWISLGAAAVGWIPLVGDGAKAAIRAGRKATTELAQEAVEQTVRHSVDDVATSVVNQTSDEAKKNLEARGAYFFGEDVLPYIDRPDATLGQNGSAHFFMPLEDSINIRSVSDAARASGNARSITNAYINSGRGFGVSFPLEGLSSRVPTAHDANGWAHYLEGGRTAVRTPDPHGGYLLNSTRELVTPGGNPMPSGSVLFEIGDNGAQIPLRSF